MRKIINQILIFCSFFAVHTVLFSVPEEFVYKNIESLKPVQLDLRLQNEEAVRAQQSMIPRSKISLLPSDVKLKKQDDVALKGVSKMPADDLKSQIQDEISRRSIGKELARNRETMKAIVPYRQAKYAMQKAKKDAKKAAYKPDIAFDPEDEYERIDLKSDVLKEHVKKLSDAGDLVRFASRSPKHLEALTENKPGIDFEPDIRGVQQGQSRLPYPAAGPGNRANQNRVRKKSPLSKQVKLEQMQADNPVIVQTLDLVAPHATGSYFGHEDLLPEESAFRHKYLLPEESEKISYFEDAYGFSHEYMDAQSKAKEIARQKQVAHTKVPDRQAGYAADKAKKDAEKAAKKPVRKKSLLSKEVMKALPAESSKSKEEKVQHAEPSKSKAKENDGLDSLINSTEEYFASISPEDADKMVQASLKDMSEEEKEEQLNFFLDAQKPK